MCLFFQESTNLRNTTRQIIVELVLPDSKHREALGLQLPVDLLVTPFVDADLGTPKCRIRLGDVSAPWTSMPETTVDEYCQLPSRKDEVWSSWQVLCVEHPSPNTPTHQCKPQSLFGALVAFRSDTAHCLGTHAVNIVKPPCRQVLSQG
jgi:hypothetical protein